jgi:hypothetical protein
MRVGGIGDREEHALAALEERQHAVLGEELVAHQAYGFDIDRERVEVKERHPELGGGGDGDIAGVGRAARDELRDDAHLALARRVERFEHGSLFHHPVLHEALWKAAEPGAWPERC